MKLYNCVFSKYGDSGTVLQDLKPNPTDMHNTISKQILANSLKEAFEIYVKTKEVDEFWNHYGTIYPHFLTKENTLMYYPVEFEL